MGRKCYGMSGFSVLLGQIGFGVGSTATGGRGREERGKRRREGKRRARREREREAEQEESERKRKEGERSQQRLVRQVRGPEFDTVWPNMSNRLSSIPESPVVLQILDILDILEAFRIFAWIYWNGGFVSPTIGETIDMSRRRRPRSAKCFLSVQHIQRFGNIRALCYA